jgi:hypothetical protein
MRRIPAVFLTVAVASSVAASARAESVHSLVQRAEAAIARGDLDPARDLAPLVEALRGASGDDARALVLAVEKLGQHDGLSPAAVKAWLQQEAAPALLEIAGRKGGWMLRADALMALRTLNASDEALDRAIALAEGDTSEEAPFFRSRAQLLREWQAARPRPPVASAVRLADERRARALAFLRLRGLGATAPQLETAASQADVEMVEALLDAGVGPNAAGVAGPMLAAAAGVACMSAPGDVERRVRTVRLLIEHGADVKARDEVGNTILMRAARSCPLPVVQALVEAGADVRALNQEGMAPLSIAFMGGNWPVAEYLIDRGARLKKADIAAVFFEMPEDEKKLAIVRRATAKQGRVTSPSSTTPR